MSVKKLDSAVFDASGGMVTVIAEVRRHFRELAFRTVIPRNVRLAEAPSHGEPVIRYDPASSGAAAYTEAAREVAARG